MQRISTSTAVNSRPAPSGSGTPGYFTNGNAATGLPGTVLDQDWANGIQETLVNPILASGQTLDPANDAQLTNAMKGFAQATTGRLLVRNFFIANTTYTPSAAARQLFIRMCGGGASGAGAVANASGSNNCNCGGAGACGGYAEFWISLAQISGPFPLTIGQGGIGSTSSGSPGGATSFGNLVTCQGGGPGQSSGFIVPGRSNFGSQSAGGMVTFNAQTGLYMYLAVTGQNGAGSFVSSSGSSVGQPLPPIGPQSQMGTGGPNGATTDSNITCSSASGYGAGSGAGASLGGGTVTAGNGGNGAIEVSEYT